MNDRSDDRVVHPLVQRLVDKLEPPGVTVGASEFEQSTAEALAASSDPAQLVMFAGFLGGVVPHDDKDWQVLYIDLELAEWLVFIADEIVIKDTVKDETVPFDEERDVLWVRANATVGRGNALQSLEAQFLTGDFTRAGDFDAPLTGGTLAAATGVFCEARTPSCCLIRSNRPR